MSQENKKPLPSSSAAGNTTSCSKQQQQEEEHNTIINGQMVPFVASSPAMEVIETHKAYYCNRRYTDVKYMECLKNHAAAMGGTATDGCGEFMPAGEDGSLDALKCSACQCHRNFHRKVIIKGQPLPFHSNFFPMDGICQFLNI